MTKSLLAIALAWLNFTGISAAEELKPGVAYSIRLDRYTGNFYYTQEQQGYEVVATSTNLKGFGDSLSSPL
jgi:hypothetical protein